MALKVHNSCLLIIAVVSFFFPYLFYKKEYKKPLPVTG